MTALPPVVPTGNGIVRFLAERPEFAGVGKATARKLWQAFGPELYRVLGSGDAARLSEVLPETQAAIVCEAWRHQQSLADCVMFFDERGICGEIARKALSFWGEEAVAKVRDNPYRLLTVCAWRQVDALAHALGLAPDDRRRWVGAVEAALYDRLDQKHTVTSRLVLERLVARLLGVSPALAVKAIEEAIADRAAVLAEGGLQPAGAAYMERFIEKCLEAMLRRGPRQDDFLARRLGRDGIEACPSEAATATLNSEQREAVSGALSNRLFVLTGGAGVGKTTCLRAIIEVAERSGLHVYQIALAGRAAQRMAQATGRPARTIAAWLKDAAEGKARTGAHTLVIVDEASMLDLPTTYRLLFHMHEDARLLLVGDVAQLPPIGFGLVLHRMVQSPSIPRVELTRIMRAVEATGIPNISRLIRDGRVPDMPDWSPGLGGCSFLEASPENVIPALEVVRAALGDGTEVQVIGAVYSGAAGIDAVNGHFHNVNARSGASLAGFAPGDPVIWTANDRTRGLWNGSLGVVEEVGGSGLSVVLDGRSEHLALAELEPLQLAYAISAHKAQGSQYEAVIVLVLPSRLLDRTWLYTAVTRATRSVVLVGSREALVQAVVRPPVSLARDVALGWP